MAKLSNEQTGGMDYITIFDGRLVQRVPEGTEGASPRELQKGPNEGKTVWEKTYSSASGLITGGGIEVKEFGGKKVKEIQVKLDDDILLQIPFNMLSHFAKPLPNVDPLKPVKISVYKSKQGKTGLNISQDGEQCEWAYTKEEPNGLPQPEQDDFGEWDFKNHDRFLTQKVLDFFERIDKEHVERESTIDEEEAPF